MKRAIPAWDSSFVAHISVYLSHHQGQLRALPAWEKLPLRRLKSVALTAPSLLKLARSSYPGPPTPVPNAALTMLKSTMLTLSELLESPALIVPISGLALPPDIERVPALARLIIPLSLQLKEPSGSPVVSVKYPLASVATLYA